MYDGYAFIGPTLFATLRAMEKDEGKTRVPILPHKLQLVFASVMGVAFVALLIFVIVKPTPVEQTTAKTDGAPEVSIDGPADRLSTVEEKKPVILAPEVTDSVTVDGGADEVISTIPETKDEAPAPVSEAPAAKPETPKKTPVKEAYTYTARAGDSYTAMARSSVALYMQAQKLTLSPAQRVAAETYLTQAVGAPLLDVAQSVTIAGESVKDAVEKAQSLSDDELAAWDIFADQVDWDNDDDPQPADDGGVSGDAIDDGGAGSSGTSGAAGGSGAPGGGAGR